MPRSKKRVYPRKSKATRKKMSLAHKGHPVSAATREKMSKAHQGLRHTPQTRKKISQAMKGKRGIRRKKWSPSSRERHMAAVQARQIDRQAYLEYLRVEYPQASLKELEDLLPARLRHLHQFTPQGLASLRASGKKKKGLPEAHAARTRYAQERKQQLAELKARGLVFERSPEERIKHEQALARRREARKRRKLLKQQGVDPDFFKT